MSKSILPLSLLVLLCCLMGYSIAQTVPVGSGSYTTEFPGTDQAGRNSFPSGTPQLSGVAATKPVPTNDWWSNMIKVDHGGQAFNYPLSFRSKSEGLVINYTIPAVATSTEYREPMSAVDAIVVGVNGMAASRSTVSDHSDWTVTLNWNNGGKDFNATMGIGMPFVYFTKGTADVARVAVGFFAEGATVSGNKIIIRNNYNNANYVVFGPAGSTWTGTGGVFTSTLNGKNYWSMVMLPFGVDVNTAVAAYEPYAFAFPANTTTDWTYNSSTGSVRTTFTVTPEVKEGTNNIVPMGLLPHQWSRLASSSAQPNGYTYHTVRGQLKMLLSNSFTTENKFSGILPTLPNLAKYSGGFDPGALYNKIDLMKGDQLPEWTDSYNEGQNMNRLIQVAHIAHQIGHIAARDQILNTVKTRLEDWFKAEGGEIAFLFYYNNDWKTMIGYPAGHRQDQNLNDHHFHWGYFIHAAAAIEQYQPGWAAQWGGMVDLLIRDAANPSRSDSMFPFLRNFSPYAGHAWANGFATEPFGNDQESTSESMQFNCSLIHWGTVTGNNAIRDLGIFLYTTEQSAVEEYWFDQNDRTFRPEYAHEMVARVWGGGYDNGTWWTQDIAASYGIQLYPIHGGALYMGHNTAYVQKVWDGMKTKTGVLSNVSNDNLWYDTYWSFLAFLDPQQAIDLYNAYPNRSIKVGISDAQTYHWLHTMNAMGQVAEEVTANYPIATVFTKNGVKTYVAHNYGANDITVNFSDGAVLNVPARSTATSRDIPASVSLVSSAAEIPTGGSVTLTATTMGSNISKVEFYRNGTMIGSDLSAPYSVTASNLTAGLPRFHARVYVGTNLNVSNIVQVQVGAQLPYVNNTPAAIPGTIEAGNYDAFEGGSGQGVSYSDATIWNEGNFRPSEAVDASGTPNEGNTVGWIEGGEYLEYTINVATGGLHNVTIRYASGSSTGGGPFWFEREDGTKISDDITVGFTDTNWSAYANKVVNGVSLQPGRQVIRVRIGNGGFNLGRMTFVYAGGTPPTVNVTSPTANSNFTAPATITIDATASDADGSVSKVEFFNGTTKLGEDTSAPYSYVWSNVVAGTYSITARATDNSSLSATSTAIPVTVTNNIAPTVSITSPANNTTFTSAPATITINASAADSDGSVTKVEFYNGATKIGEDTTSPYSFNWSNVAAGNYSLSAKATDNLSATTSSAIVAVTVENSGNVPPSVNITSPTNGSSFTAPASITLTANASDTDGTVTKVEFYNGGLKIGEDTSSPYSYSWNNVAAGNYTLTVIATDNSSASTTSAAINVSVTGVAICTGNGPVASGQTVPDYTWQATNTANPTVTFIPGTPIAGSTMSILYYKVNNGGYIGEIMNASGSNFTKQINASLGSTVSIYFTYRIGNTGMERNSSATPHSFTVGQCGGSSNVAPTATITSPANNATFTAPASITISADASDTDGTIAKVEFYNGTTKLGEDTSAPYSFIWSGVTAGSYSLAVKAFDNLSAETSSSPVNVTVNPGNGGGTCTGTVANGDYSYEVSTTATGTVNWKFIPLAPIAGSTMAIIYIKAGSGGYAGYIMNASGSNFEYSQNHPAGTVLTFYFTYRVGNTGIERNSAATPHTYTAGASCSGRLRTSFNESNDAEGMVKLYPNPVRDRLHVDGVENKTAFIDIVDGQGRTTQLQLHEDKTVDVSTLPSGLYTIVLLNKNRRTVHRFVKQ